MVEGEKRQIQETPEHISEENNAKNANEKTQKEEGELQESSQSDQEKSVQQDLNETAESVIISKHQAKKFTQDTENTCDSTIQHSQETTSIQQEKTSNIHANVDSAMSMQENHDDSFVENKNTSTDQINSSN